MVAEGDASVRLCRSGAGERPLPEACAGGPDDAPPAPSLRALSTCSPAWAALVAAATGTATSGAATLTAANVAVVATDLAVDLAVAALLTELPPVVSGAVPG